MPLTHEEILKRVSEARALTESADIWLGDGEVDGYDIHSAGVDAYAASRILEDLERDLTSDLLAEQLVKDKLPIIPCGPPTEEDGA